MWPEQNVQQNLEQAACNQENNEIFYTASILPDTFTEAMKKSDYLRVCISTS